MDPASPSPMADVSRAIAATQPVQNATGVPVESASCNLGSSLTSGLVDKAYRSLVDALPQPVFFKNCDSVFVYVNAAMAAKMNRQPEEIIGRTDHDFFPRELADKYRQDDRRVMASGRPQKIEESFSTPGGDVVIEVVKSPILSDTGEVAGLMGVFIDVTERKQAMDVMRRSEEELRRVWEDSLDGMRITDEEGIVLRVNSAYCRMVRKTAAEMVGRPFSVIYETDQPMQILDRHRKRFAERNVEPMFERELLLWNGEKVWFELSNSFLEVPGQKPHLLSIFRDISERKIAEEQSREFAARLERSNRELQDFAYVASHDLQEPLRKIAVFSDRLRSKHGQGMCEEARDYLDRMQKAALRMQALITDLLMFSRVGTKFQPFARVDLNTVTREVAQDLEGLLEQTGGQIETGPLPVIEAEPLHMRQLLQNLVANALKFRKPEVKPVVRIEAFTFKEFASGNHGTREMMQLIVSDNGIGFDEKYLDRIFQVFQRLHNRAAYEGTGMGLAIARKIVEHHKGQITAKSKPGEGATFIVILPVKQLIAAHT